MATETNNTTDIKRNVNYTGNDMDIAKWQAKCDECATEIGRMLREKASTLTSDDKLEIQQIASLWTTTFDSLDRETFLTLVTENVKYRSNAFGDADGRENLGTWLDNVTSSFNGKRHVMTNFVITGEGNKATMLSYLTVFERITGAHMVGSVLLYDQLVKQDGKWLISDRLEILDPGMNAGK